MSTASSYLQVDDSTRGGEAVFDWAGDDDYIAQVSVDLNGGATGDIHVRREDPNNYYMVELSATKVALHKVWRGKFSTISSVSHSASGTITMKVLLSGSTIKVWVAGTLKINTADSEIASGGLGLGGDSPRFSSIKVGYDDNAVADDNTSINYRFQESRFWIWPIDPIDGLGA